MTVGLHCLDAAPRGWSGSIPHPVRPLPRGCELTTPHNTVQKLRVPLRGRRLSRCHPQSEALAAGQHPHLAAYPPHLGCHPPRRSIVSTDRRPCFHMPLPAPRGAPGEAPPCRRHRPLGIAARQFDFDPAAGTGRTPLWGANPK